MADESHGGVVEDKVRMYHSAFDEDAYVTEEQFTIVWEPLGWQRRSDTATRRLEKQEG